MARMFGLLLACADTLLPDGPADDPTASDPGTDPVDTETDPGTTLPDPADDPDCSAPLVQGPLPVGRIERIQTEEDFDFDADGNLVAQNNNNLVGYPRSGGTKVIAPNIGIDAAGIRALTTGDFVVAQPDVGVVKLIDGETGGASNALTDLQGPNGLEVGVDGYVYVSEFNGDGGLRVADPYTGDEVVLLASSLINSIALSPDEQVLYVTSHQYYGGGFDGIAALDRRPDGTWERIPREVMPTGTLIQGLVTDKCGNLYAVESTTGNVFRINAADGSVDPLAELGVGGYGFFSSARFGTGIGGWNRTELYVTDRQRIYLMDVGIEGRHVLAEP